MVRLETVLGTSSLKKEDEMPIRDAFYICRYIYSNVSSLNLSFVMIIIMIEKKT